MATSKKRTAEIQAGFVVIIGLAILAAGLYWVDGGADQWRKKTTYTIFFANAGGLSEGNDVMLDGRKVGEVLLVRAADESELPATILGHTYGNCSVVQAKIFKSERIPIDSKIQTSKSITGTVSLIIISSEKAQYVSGDTRLEGEARADFEALTHEAKQLLAEVSTAVREFQALAQKASTQVDAIGMAQLREDIGKLVKRGDEFVARLDKLVAEGSDDTLAMLSGAREAVTEFKELGTTLKGDWTEKLEPQAERALTGAADLVEDAKPKLTAMLQKLDDFGDFAGKAMVRIDDLAAEMQDTVVEGRPHLIATLRKARQAMADFAETTNDLKTSPWKLVNKPSGGEIKRAYFYNAAQVYLRAAQEAREAVDDLKTLKSLGALTNQGGQEAVDRATKRLDEAVDKMNEQEAAITKGLAAGK